MSCVALAKISATLADSDASRLNLFNVLAIKLAPEAKSMEPADKATKSSTLWSDSKTASVLNPAVLSSIIAWVASTGEKGVSIPV